MARPPGSELSAYQGGTQLAPAGVGEVEFSVSDGVARATLVNSELDLTEHNLGILLIDEATGVVVPLNHTLGTWASADESGFAASVSLDLGGAVLPDAVRVYLMVDAYPAVVGSLAAEEP